MFARAVGRGRKGEAEIAWGERIANQVTELHATVLEEPTADQDVDRILRPYLLGIPLIANQRYLGTLVYIRFGGPPFIPKEVQIAEFIAQQISLLVDRQHLQREYAQLESKNQQLQFQEDFVSMISHELRTPLGFIKGYSTTLLRSDTTWDPMTTREFLQIIDDEADHLQNLIDNLLDSARLQSGQLPMSFESIRIDTIIADVISRAITHNPGLIIKMISEKKINPIIGDPNRMNQVFENLVSNATKYAHGSTIEISIHQNYQGTSFEVRDQGPGIAESDLPFIFNRFFRSVSQSPNIHGTGLGLFICRQIVLAHQGQISVTSSIGKGTIFNIFLPYRRI